ATITINDTSYSVERIPAVESATVAYRLTKQSMGGEVYDVAPGRDGVISCDCADYEIRRRGLGLSWEPCKHGRARVGLGRTRMRPTRPAAGRVGVRTVSRGGRPGDGGAAGRAARTRPA